MQTCLLKPFKTDLPRYHGAMFGAPDIDAQDLHYDFAKGGVGSGSMRCHVSADCMITAVDGRFDRSVLHQCVVGSDLLLVRAAVSSDCGYAPNDAVPWQFRRPAITVSTLPKGTRLDIRIDTGAPQRTITVLMRPSMLLRHHGIESNLLPEPLRAVLESTMTAPTLLAALPLDSDVATLVNDVVHSRLTGALKRMQVQARALELLALMAASWNERLSQEHCPGARGRDGALVASARRILSERFADPPTLQALATQLGTNKNKLNQLFQRHLGVTPQAFCLQRRIERAQALIAEGRLNVGQIADEVGYQHQSSFAVAFREAVGLSPREFARLHRAPDRRVAPAVH